MPRVHFVKKARKDNPVVKKGESYYYWEFRYGGKRYSATPPLASQLTQSHFLSTVLKWVEIPQPTFEDVTDFDEWKQEMRDQVEELQSETQDSLDNMPESLQYAPTGELLQERIDELDSMMSEIESVEVDIEDEPDSDDFLDEEDPEEAYEEAKEIWETDRDNALELAVEEVMAALEYQGG